jgi:hypothetical protein
LASTCFSLDVGEERGLDLCEGVQCACTSHLSANSRRKGIMYLCPGSSKSGIVSKCGFHNSAYSSPRSRLRWPAALRAPPQVVSGLLRRRCGAVDDPRRLRVSVGYPRPVGLEQATLFYAHERLERGVLSTGGGCAR